MVLFYGDDDYHAENIIRSPRATAKGWLQFLGPSRTLLGLCWLLSRCEVCRGSSSQVSGNNDFDDLGEELPLDETIATRLE